MPVFKSMPSGQPKVANAKEDHTWQRHAVEGTIREWFRFMNVTQKAAEQIRPARVHVTRDTALGHTPLATQRHTTRLDHAAPQLSKPQNHTHCVA